VAGTSSQGHYGVRSQLTGWLFLLPGFGIICLCVLLPAALALGLSFTNCSRFLTVQWAGLDNYRRILTDPVALKAVGNTLYYLALFVPTNLALALGIALLLNRRFPGIKFIRSVYFVPVAVSGIVAVSIFRFLFNYDNGPINAVISTMGFEPVPWLASEGWAMIAIVMITLWKSTAFFSIIFLAALQDVPQELYEAASVDGAGRWAKFFHVTAPSLLPVIMIVFTLSAIGAFRIFEPMFVLTRGGPADSTVTVSLLAYGAAFSSGELGYANAISFVLLTVILAVTLVLNRISRKLEARW